MTSEGSVSSNSLRRRKKSSKVHLNIYTLSQAKGISNKLSNKFGFKKAYHTAVEVYGIEYSYDETRGIYAAKPREVKNAKLKKALYMGTANMKWPEVKNIVSELRCAPSKDTKLRFVFGVQKNKKQLFLHFCSFYARKPTREWSRARRFFVSWLFRHKI
mmetsp:Transcript_8239/g.9148  ORF Transcript_8239/g.9148 Transcript_8239/m.9148 type:complete len:159 (-) Transcript_8239:766-1242(-)